MTAQPPTMYQALNEVWTTAEHTSGALPTFAVHDGWDRASLSAALGYLDFSLAHNTALTADYLRAQQAPADNRPAVLGPLCLWMLRRANDLADPHQGTAYDGYPIGQITPWLAMAAGFTDNAPLAAWSTQCGAAAIDPAGLYRSWQHEPGRWGALAYAAGLTADEARAARHRGTSAADLAAMAASRGHIVHPDLLDDRTPDRPSRW